MQIRVTTAGDAFDRQTRAYAEYRVFSALAAFSGEARHVDVVLKARTRGGDRLACRVTVALALGTTVTVTADGKHACDAIDRAAAQMASVMARTAGGEDIVNMYRVAGDLIGTEEARDLALQLVGWHDNMVKHLRQVRLRGAGCDEECPHEQARSLWRMAVAVFGAEAEKFTFLQTHGGMTTIDHGYSEAGEFGSLSAR
jgi:hypothetical protein